jgi:hypothetical protein
MKAIPTSSATAATNAKIRPELPLELDSVEEVLAAVATAGAVCVVAGAVVFGAAAPCGVFDEVLGVAAGAVAVEGAGAGVVAAGVLGVAGVAGAVVVGVAAGGANTAAPAALGSAKASTISRHSPDLAALNTDVWVMEIERIVPLWSLASIAPGAFAGKYLVPGSRMGAHTP